MSVSRRARSTVMGVGGFVGSHLAGRWWLPRQTTRRVFEAGNLAKRAVRWQLRRLARRVTPLLRRVGLQARSGTAYPGGVGPLLVVGPFEWVVGSPYRTYVRMVETVLEGTAFRLVDTSHKRGQVIDLDR